jgi:AP-3 complex subunit beta
MIDDIRHPKAKACAIWLVGQYAASSSQWNGIGIEGIVEWAPDVLRKTAKSFTEEVGLPVMTYCAQMDEFFSRCLALNSKLSLWHPSSLF